MSSAFDYPESDQIEPEQARFLHEQHCAILILEDLPEGSEFGFDLMTYRIGPKFKGVKIIPPGIHFVYASAIERNNTQHCGPRCGFFHEFKAKELLVKRWSELEEDFDESFQPTIEQLTRYQENLRSLDSHLAPYSFSTYKTYLNLTNKLTPEVIKRLMPSCNRIRSVPFLTKTDSTSSEEVVTERQGDEVGTSRPTEQNLLPELKPHPSTAIHFSKIPTDHIDSKQSISHDMITSYNLDTTMKLEHTFKGDKGQQLLLAELQFAFVSFILCHVYECFEQWKRILTLVLLADSGLKRFPSFYREFLSIFRHQLDLVPEDLFDDIADSNNLVRHLLDSFCQNLDFCPDNSTPIYDLKSYALELRDYTENKFGWQFNLEREDEQPVVVEM